MGGGGGLWGSVCFLKRTLAPLAFKLPNEGTASFFCENQTPFAQLKKKTSLQGKFYRGILGKLVITQSFFLFLNYIFLVTLRVMDPPNWHGCYFEGESL